MTYDEAINFVQGALIRANQHPNTINVTVTVNEAERSLTLAEAGQTLLEARVTGHGIGTQLRAIGSHNASSRLHIVGRTANAHTVALTYGALGSEVVKERAFYMGSLIDAAPEIRRVFSHEVLNAATRAVSDELRKSQSFSDYHAEVRKAQRRVSRAFARIMPFGESYRAATMVFGRKPMWPEMLVVSEMLPALRPLLDTPSVLAPVVSQRVDDYRKRLRDHTRAQSIERTRRLTPKKVTMLAKKLIDPTGRLLPRQWRWYAHQRTFDLKKADINVGRPRLPRIAFLADYCPRREDYVKHTMPLAHLAGMLPQQLNPVEEVFVRAIVKRIKSRGENANKPFDSATEWQAMLLIARHKPEAFRVDGDFKRASIERLHALVRGMPAVELPESLKYGRHEFKHPVPRTVVNGLVFEPLESHAMIFDEGQKMRHCLFNAWMPHHINGSYRSYRVLTEGGEHRGTLLLQNSTNVVRSHGWSLGQYCGLNNRTLSSDEVRPFLDMVR
jgi:hypothetical protein